MSAYPVFYARSKSIQEHVGYIIKTKNRSIRDPEVRQLAVKIVSSSYVWRANPRTGVQEPYLKAWNRYFIGEKTPICPPRDDQCEIVKIWNFVVRNFRYVYDPATLDTFATAKLSLEAGGGDCFPVGTLVLREDGRIVPIETIQVGDFIHDGVSFVEVLKTWDRGLKPIHAMTLNNGDVLRLSDTHKVLRVPRGDYTNPNTGKILRNATPGRYESAEETRVYDLKVGDDLLQPREFGGGSIELSEDDAFLVGAYLAEGCKTNGGRDSDGVLRRSQVSIAGISNGKGIRERVIDILSRRGVAFNSPSNAILFKVVDVPILAELDLGNTAIDKHLPHLDWGPQTVANIVAAMEQGDGGLSTSGKNMVYSTISTELALQYRVLKRMLGNSVAMKCLVEHGGAGKNPIYRMTVRVNDKFRPWAHVKAIAVEDEEQECVDIMTASGRVYLPESDVLLRNCDDATILFSSLLESIGFHTRCRVISTPDEPENWVHIYPLVGVPKDDPSDWLPLDCTVSGYKPGQEWPKIAKLIDFEM